MKPGFDKVADIYDATRREAIVEVVDAMERVLSRHDSVLDVGIGTGRYAKPLQDRGFHVMGVDISQAMMEKARGKGIRDLVRGDVHRLPLKGASFDAALIILVLHLVKDWVDVVREVGRVSAGPVLSLVGGAEGPMVRSEYLRLRTEAGFPTGRFDEGEEGLRKLIPPIKLIPVSDSWVESNADESIAHFAQRQSSITWDLPEHVHSRIVEKIRGSLGGKVLRQRSVDEVAVWEPEQLRNLAKVSVTRSFPSTT